MKSRSLSTKTSVLRESLKEKKKSKIIMTLFKKINKNQLTTLSSQKLLFQKKQLAKVSSKSILKEEEYFFIKMEKKTLTYYYIKL